MDDELDEIRQKKLDELTEKMGIQVMQKKERKVEEDDGGIYDLVLPGWIPPWVAEKTAPEVGVELVERKIQGVVTDPETGAPSDMMKMALCIRGSLNDIERFKMAAVEQLKQFMKSTSERKLTEPSSWWKHYHIDEWDDVRKNKNYDPDEEWKRFKKAGLDKFNIEEVFK